MEEEESRGLSRGNMFPYRGFSLGFLALNYLFETYIDIRQLHKNSERIRPKNLEGIVDDKKFLEAQAYTLDKGNFHVVKSFFDIVKSIAILALGVIPFFWATSGSLVARFGYSSEILHSLVFVLIFTLSEMALSIPFDLYSTFVIEERHGFNKQTLRLFVVDLLKGLLLGIVIGGVALAALLYIIQWGGELFYLYAWLFVFAFQMIMLAIYPVYIQPLFNKLEPLPEGSLRSKIQALATRTKFPLAKLFVIDGSKRSSHSNAYFYGFFKNKQVVLFDTLIEQMTEEEVLAVLGHEFGHWQMSHTLKNLFIVQAHLFLLFFLFGQFINNHDLYRSFGFHETFPTIIGLMLFQFIYNPVEQVLGFLMNLLSRKFEFEADQYSKRLGYEKELRSGLIKLQIKNLSNMNPDPWYSTYHYSHPPLVERLNALDSTQAKSD